MPRPILGKYILICAIFVEQEICVNNVFEVLLSDFKSFEKCIILQLKKTFGKLPDPGRIWT